MTGQEENVVTLAVWKLAMGLPALADEPAPKSITLFDAVNEMRLRCAALLLTAEALTRENQALHKILAELPPTEDSE